MAASPSTRSKFLIGIQFIDILSAAVMSHTGG